ncbi:FunK1 protein kinase [Trichophyton tonsurans CBS 112818]|uniref:FunK1 protein kinase n=1 Tax=Trichophyton tonsurans (strain CBS 112818) TaxID=647933 RepID=F2S2D9_TRIT1|nr:FunK1 protein kinase [Trichophyton tonsurans CBS 112818]
MVDLSPDDLDVMERYPLSGSLDKLGELLQDAEKVYNSQRSDSLDRLYRNAISKLVHTLQGAEAACHLRSWINDEKINIDLSDLFSSLQKENANFNYSPYRALIHLVLAKAPDVDIWKAVYQLIEAVSQLTPPATVPPTSDGTPWRSTSSSQRGNEQTRKLVEERLFDETRTCTHKDVEGFDAKYFRNTSWEERFMDIYKKIQERDDTGLSDFPDPPIQNDILDWGFQLQNTSLAETRGIYFSTESKKSLKDSGAERQVDVLMKARGGDKPAPTHSWKDICVVGGLKRSNYNKKDTINQIDSGSFDIRNEPDRFFCAIIGYTLISDEELGLDIFTVLHDDGARAVHVEDVDTGEKKPLRLEPMPISVRLAVVCRGTCCYLTTPHGPSRSQSVVKFSWTSVRRQPEVYLLQKAYRHNVEGVARVIGYRSITSIAELRKDLHFKNVYQFRSIAPSISSSSTQSFTELQGLSIAKGSSAGSRKRKQSTQSAAKSLKRLRSSNLRLDSAAEENEVAISVEETQKASLYATKGEELFENRVLRCLVIYPADRAIHKFDSPEELFLALRDAIRAHRSLYIKGEILHRDISENNIVITDPKVANGYSGMLIDLDLAKELGRGPTGARHRTGTMEFMAIEVLLNIVHTYRHDLESFFYVLIWQCARNGWERYTRSKEKPHKSRLKMWYTGSYEDIADVKTDHMDPNRFEDLFQGFPPELDQGKSLCRELRGLLFPYRNGLVVGTPADPERLYDSVTQASDKAIERLWR